MAPYILIFQLLSFSPTTPKSFLSWQLPAKELFLNDKQRGYEGLRLVYKLRGLLQEVLYQRWEEIDSQTSWEQWW